jgi:hypothetical protein
VQRKRSTARSLRRRSAGTLGLEYFPARKATETTAETQFDGPLAAELALMRHRHTILAESAALVIGS